ncbi:MBL fold metallo-hydrolase [Rhodoferax koreense]|uniref:MBL fold metallo-hydrolase n=1 Tax=Rhodoferax koreensis TaxID=1842727 RepID=A0A1P8JV37_9BURK|nr:MBL fold metallo-hydrolase [Rhodoferax koreense]APW37598.1 MBL fold metallo-hydrolase [Rhodoferax koreense]
MIRFKNLGSGSTGNATVIEAGNGLQTKRLLVDCGLGIRQLDFRLNQAGLQADEIDAIFITHEHSDHIGCVRQMALRYRIPVWMSQGTHLGMGLADFDGLLHVARDSQPIDLGELQVLPFTVPHDAREPLQLSCTDGAGRMGVLTDLGHASSHVLEHVAGCHTLLLECNHDPELLSASRYPPFLKRRVAGPYGHLANQAAAEIAEAVAGTGLRKIVAAHLSQQNNRPDLALAALAGVSACAAVEMLVAHPVDGTDWLAV